MPSTNSSSVCSVRDSSTVTTPSLPTLSIASEISFPIAESLLAETEATLASSSLLLIGLDSLPSSATTASVAIWMPCCSDIGFAPAATFLMPSRNIAWARTVAVVVPSPAVSLVLTATSRNICAPRFSYLSFRSISLATVTPSLVTTGEPYFLPSTTLRPFGPRVTRTAFAIVLTPFRIAFRASSLNFSSFAATLVSPHSLLDSELQLDYRFKGLIRWPHCLPRSFRLEPGPGARDDRQSYSLWHIQKRPDRPARVRLGA